LFELLLHGGDAAALVEWWQKFPARSFRYQLDVDLGEDEPEYGNIVM
jgi:hypothetical protein